MSRRESVYHLTSKISKTDTVKVMIMSRYRYRPVTVTHRRPPLPTVHHRYRTLLTVTDRYRILPLLALQALSALH
jgi:hypothetical protein